jgi:hypothetical protein
VTHAAPAHGAGQAGQGAITAACGDFLPPYPANGR